MKNKRKKIFGGFVFLLVLVSSLLVGAKTSSVPENQFIITYVEAEELMDYSALQVYDPRTFDADSDENTFNYLPDVVKNQGNLGLCWAYAIAGSIEIDLYKNFGVEVDIAERYLAYYAKNGYDDESESLTYADGLKTVNSSSGTIDYDAIFNGGGNFTYTLNALVAGIGLVEQDYVDNTYSVSTFKGTPSEYANYRIGDVARVVGGREYASSTSIDIIKDLIVDKGSVIISLEMEDYSTSNYYNSSAFAYFTPSSLFSATDHMVEVVGWDDNFSRSNFKISPSTDGAWLVRNSWGTSFGDGGYVWVSYEDAGIKSSGYSVIDLDKYKIGEVLYQYELGTYSYLSYPNASITGGNIFKNASAYQQELNSVGVYVYTDSSSKVQNLKIDVYTSLSSMSNPTDGTKVSTITKNFSENGYYKIDLSSPVTLSSGESFSIVVTVSCSNGSAYLCVEGDDRMLDSATKLYASSKSNVSFLKNGSAWQDLSTSAAGAVYNNVGLKAYTSFTECETHTYGSGVVVDKTCTSYAKTIYTCTLCGHEKIEEDTDGGMLEHSYNIDLGYTEGDCLNSGYNTFKCGMCKVATTKVYDNNYGDHQYIKTGSTTTCVTLGKSTYECSVIGCGHTIERDDEEYAGHTLVNGACLDGDCHNYKVQLMDCLYCDYSEGIELKEDGYGKHKFDNKETENGVVHVTCSVDGCKEAYDVKSVEGVTVVDCLDVDTKSFTLAKIDGVYNEIWVKLKLGVIKFRLDDVSLKGSYFTASIQAYNYEDVKTIYNVNEKHKNNTVYFFDLSMNGAKTASFQVEVYTDTGHNNTVRFIKVDSDGSECVGGICDGGVYVNVSTGLYILQITNEFVFGTAQIILISILIVSVALCEVQAMIIRRKKKKLTEEC